MRNIISFTNVSVDGFFAGPRGEIDWFKREGDDEERKFSEDASRSPATLIMGRTTYEMMASFWPTPYAIKSEPVMAEVMNDSPKMVFSRTMKPVMDGQIWKGVTVVPEFKPEEMMNLKEDGNGTYVILGSGSIVQQFAHHDLIDEYQLMVHPVILGAGKYLFKDFSRMNLNLLETRTFRSGKVFLKYVPV